MKFNVKHKVRFDRGRVYYSYGNSIITAALVFIFSQGNWINSILSSVCTILIIYCIGYLDQKLNILKREQKIYGEENPVLMDILKQIKELNENISNNDSIQSS